MDKNRLKRILDDPVGMYKGMFQEQDNELTRELEQLHRRHDQLKKEYKACRGEAGRLSRQIGEAKISGESETIDLLKRRMRELSGECGELHTRMTEMEDRILSVFRVDIRKIKATGTDAVRWRNDPKPDQYSRISLLAATGQDAEWNDYVDVHPAATLYHRSEWRHVIGRCFGHPHYYLLSRRTSGAISGVLPLIRLKSPWFGDFLVSMPYFNYGGALGDSQECENVLIERANSLADELGVSHVEYRDDIERQDMPCRMDKVNMILDLPGTPDALWDALGAKLRAQIKRASRERPTVRRGGQDCLDDFYHIFSRNMRDLGTPVYSKEFFRSILSGFSRYSAIMVVSINGKPVSGAFLMKHGRMLEIPWASTIADFNHTAVNMLLYWEVLKYAIESGCDRFDFGRSSIESGTYRFKQQWGARPRQMYWNYWMRCGGEPPRINPSNPKYRSAIALWRRLPLPIANLLGPHVVKYIP